MVKTNPNYIQVSLHITQQMHSSSVTKTNHLALHTEIITIVLRSTERTEIHSVGIVQNFCMLKPGGTWSKEL